MPTAPKPAGLCVLGLSSQSAVLRRVMSPEGKGQTKENRLASSQEAHMYCKLELSG